MKRQDDVDAPIATSYDPWGRSLVNALRRWIAVPIILAVLGAGAGMFAGSRGKPTAEAMLRVESTATDGAAMKIVQQSTVLELETAPIYETAAERAGTTARDLRTRTQIGAVPDSQLISVTVTAPTVDDATAEANAIVDTAIAANDEQTKDELANLTKSTRSLLSAGKLPDNNAEQARVSRLGDTLGQNQSNLVAGSRSLTLLHGAESSSILPSTKLLAALGLLAGALLGGVIALLVGARRGRIQSARELHQLYPNAVVVDGLDLESVITLEAENTTTVYIAGIHRDPGELTQIAAAVGTQFAANGRQVGPHDPRHGVAMAERVDHLQIVTTTLSDMVLRRVGRDSSSLLIIPVLPKVTKMQQLEPFAARLNDRTYLLVESATPGWG